LRGSEAAAIAESEAAVGAPLHFCLRTELICQPYRVGVAVKTVVGQESQYVEVVFKILDLYGDNDLVFSRRTFQSIPEIQEAKLPRAVRECGIENQTQGLEQIALSYAVFADNHYIAGERYVELGEVTEVWDFNLRYMLAPCPSRRHNDVPER
jgi:hypothetical protein